MALDLEAIGLTKEELQARVVDALVERLTSTEYEEEAIEDRIRTTLHKRLQSEIDAAVAKIADETVTPRIVEIIAKTTFQATTRWGEKQGEPKTFLEYLVDRAEKFTTEQVDWNGKDNRDGVYDWRGKTTRIAYMIDKHIHLAIESHMKALLADANSKIAAGVADAVKMSMAEILKNVKATVAVPR